MEFSALHQGAALLRSPRLMARRGNGKVLQAALHFDPPADKPVQVRCGISAVSAANALKNLRAEQTDWDFSATRAKAKAAWQRELSRIRIDGATPDQQAIFYTSLYHMMCAPTMLDDVNGEYRGMDNQVHTLASGPAQLLQLLSMGHLSRPAPRIHPLPAGACAIDCELSCRHGGAKPSRHARMAAAGRRNRHHDRLPLGQRDGRSLRQKFPGYRLGSRLQGDAQAQHGRRLSRPRALSQGRLHPCRPRRGVRFEDARIRLRRLVLLARRGKSGATTMSPSSSSARKNYKNLFDKEDALRSRQARERRVGHTLRS